MTADAVVQELRSLGSETTKRVLMRHGAREPFFGVKVEDLKTIQKRIKVDHALALELYDTGISDAMYLAGLIADDRAMTKKDLQHWLDGAYWSMLSESTVPWVAVGSPHGPTMARKWMASRTERVAAAGWCTLAGLLAVTADASLDLDELRERLERVRTSIHDQPNRVRYTMNAFVLALGIYVRPLANDAVQAAEEIGTVSVNTGETSCKVPYAPDYIRKAWQRGALGKKRKTVKC